jgi:uncharacterized protein YndB with AHSA1/START domain
MESTGKTVISVQATINAPMEIVWKCWITPEDIVKWNNASDDWHTPRAENDLRPGGKFKYRMEAKDGNFGFDFAGVYDQVKTNQYIEYTIGDGRNVKIVFTGKGDQTDVVESFEAETTHSVDQQRNGWQAILNNFKKHVEESSWRK